MKTIVQFDEFLFDSLLQSINLTLQTILLEEWDDDAKIDFHCGCTRDEKIMLQNVISIVTEANPKITKKNTYIALLYYYYVCIVIEYYATEIFDFKKITKKIKGINLLTIKNLVNKITLSDEPWASHVRRIVNNLNP